MRKEKIDKRNIAKADVLERAEKRTKAKPESMDKTDAKPFVDKRGWDRKRVWVSPKIISIMAQIIETAMIATSGFCLWLFYSAGADLPSPIYYCAAIISLICVMAFAFKSLHLYSIPALRDVMKSSLRITIGLIAIFAIILGGTILFDVNLTHGLTFLGPWLIISLALVFALRTGLSVMVRRLIVQGRLKRSAVIIGGGQPAVELIRALNASPDNDIRIIGIFDDRSDDRVPALMEGYRKIGTIDELAEFARKVRIDIMIVSFPINAENRLLEVLKKLWVLPVDIRLSAHNNKVGYQSRAYSYVGDVPLLDIADKPLSEWDLVLKTIEDRVIAAFALVMLSPVMALVALAVKLDSKGPIFFKQNRYGFNNDLIGVYKFRSLRHESSDNNAAKLVSKNDDRVTRVGRFIRKTSMDELPQLLNVLKGELSLVGPRPHAVLAKAADSLYDEVVDGYYARHRMKPGITGWAQISGWRGETDTSEKIQKRVDHDLYYIENWSLLFDLYILVKTPLSLINTDSAY